MVATPAKRHAERPPEGERPAKKLAAAEPEEGELRRAVRDESQAYGRQFRGCGRQSDYDLTTKLGEGTFGSVGLLFHDSQAHYFLSSEVHKAIQKHTGTVVALKRILMHNEKEGMPVTALREIKILRALNHPCIVNILDMFVVRSKLLFNRPS